MSWVLFATSAWLAVLLFVWLISEAPQTSANKWVEFVKARGLWLPPLAGLGCLVGACGMWWIRGWLREWKAIWLTILLGLPSAILLALANQFVATFADVHSRAVPISASAIFLSLSGAYAVYWFRKVRLDPNATHLEDTVLGLGAAILFALVVQICAARIAGKDVGTTAEYMTIVFVIFLVALAGAMRFLSEKLAIEAEALSYRDAHGWFEHADTLLAAIRPGSGDPASDERAREIVRNLGVLALGESEAWLKLRRERPLSPVM